MRCKAVLTRVDALRTGEVPADEEREVQEHLKRCGSCNNSLADVSSLASRLKALVTAPPRSCCEEVTASLSDSLDSIREAEETVWVAFTGRGLRLVYRGGSEEAFRELYAERYGRTLEPAKLPDRLRTEVIGAIRGEGVDKPHVDWTEGTTELEREVLTVLSKIPRGEVRTYEWVARQIGRPRASRAVGNVCARNAVPFVVPCHRVVPSSGGVGNYLFGSASKRELLRREGVDVLALESLARNNVRFIGSRTTKIACFPTCKDARRIREENRVPFHGADEAVEKGFRPCRRCQPFAA